ncbi:MAG: hypothetical protein DRJ42_10430 [Deltaproteobacteria bacterium]|nr:MAG: hypothetical protein DRJ42_10430 [Deltaproteobacteria bacterium]
MALAGCAADAEPLPQTVLYVDTDVPVPSFADTLRIEVVEADGTVSESRKYVLPNISDWPVSFGIVPREDFTPTLLRMRLYEASRIIGRNPAEALLHPGLELDEPLPAFVVDRMVEVRPGAGGAREQLVILHGECMGVATDFETGSNCIASVLDPAEGARAGVFPLDGPPDPDAPPRAGTWEAARERPCTGVPRSESGLYDEEVCVPGGVFFIGDGRLGVNANPGAAWASIPERLVRISPFFMDRYEVTVGRINAAVREGFVLPPDEHVPRADMSLCNLTTDGSNDHLPMNCLSKELAQAFCAFDGGRLLPSEAQWEYAASGRGDERLYVWGDQPATCDDAVYARIGPNMAASFGIYYESSVGRPGECVSADDGPEAEGSQSVGSVARDATKDGIFDLGGNVWEWTRDSFIPLTDACWAAPYLVDPVCVADGVPFIARGGTWSAAAGALPNSLRRGVDRDESRGFVADSFSGFATGFRCVRADP